MIFAILSLISAIIIGLGRQSAAIGKVRTSLWFFSYFEKKRVVFTSISVGFGLLSLFLYDNSIGINIILVSALLLVLFSFFFDMTYFFPEIKLVEKKGGKALNINDDIKIMGVCVNEVAIAYPFDIVMTRHIINDKIDSTGILVSFCAMCRSGLIFSPMVDGEILYFKVAGVWRRNMIMVDNKTQSLWQQATGECIYGTHKGKQLKLLSGENTTWGAWLESYPNSLFASKCVEARKGLMSRERMMKGLEFATTKIHTPGFTELDGLPKRETVFGIEHNGIAKVYAKSELKNATKFMDEYGGLTIQLEYDAKNNNLTAIDINSKKRLIVERHWWLGWKEFHPQTIIWKKSTTHNDLAKH